MATKICYIISILTGVGLLFIGLRFLVSPVQAEFDFGIFTNTHADYSFHYIKGIRDIFSGILLLTLAISKERKALGLALLCATIVPLGDFLIVIGTGGTDWQHSIAHLIAIAICLIIGPILLMQNSTKKAPDHKMSFNLIQSAADGGTTISECHLLPGAKTPWHYHTLFSEKFEVLEGELEVGKGGKRYQLKAGDAINILPYEKHLFNNGSKIVCRIRTTIDPGNLPFEKASLILLGLANDGLTNSSGIPRKFSDLALFIYLNNSRMTGVMKLAEPFLNLVAKIAIRRGRLNALENSYCKALKSS
jgi:quercetin dioxygenase-like cupin family protein